jgi:hypothetical protein
MAMIACPGCGLPREDDRIGVVPCPVCVAAPAPEPIAAPTTNPALSNPIAGLPADVSQMEARAARTSGRRILPIAIVCAFLLGIAAGAGGLLAWQEGWKEFKHPPGLTNDSVMDQPTNQPMAVAPLPHVPNESLLSPAARTTKSQSAFRPESEVRVLAVAPAVARQVNIPLNQPDAAYTIPRPVERGEHMILRGKVRMLRVNGLGPGAVVDASDLEAGSIYVGGTIEGGSILRLRCPDGVVEVPAAVSGRARLEIDAPGSSVRFLHPSTPDKPGSRIDGGATVIITARSVDLRGDVAGADTSVRVALTRNGSLKVAAVRGAAAVEYCSENRLAPEPTANAATVEPSATFRKITGR